KVVANEKRVGGVDVMVDLHVKGVGIFNTDGVGLIVVCKTGTGRRSDVAEKFLGNRTDTVVRNNVPFKRLPACTVGVAGAWIIDDLRRRQIERGAQIARAEIHRWDRGSRRISAPVPERLIVSKEECLVFDDWPTERETILIVDGVRSRRSKGVARRQCIDAIEFINAA